MLKRALSNYFPFVVAVVAVATLAIALQRQTDVVNASALRTSVQAEVDVVSARLQSQVESSVLITRGIASLLSRGRDISQAEFSQLVSNVTRGRSDVINVAWAPDLVITRVHPVEPNRAAIGLDYRNIPAQLAAIEKVRDTGQIAFVGPIDLVQGGKGFILRIPVYSRTEDILQFRGILSTVFDLNAFLDRAGMMGVEQPLNLTLANLDNSGAIAAIAYGDRSVIDDHPIETNFDFTGSHWRLYATPEEGWDSATEKRIYQILRLLIVCLFVLGPLYLLNRMALARKEMITDMQTANRRLDSFTNNFPGVFFTYMQRSDTPDRVTFATDGTRDIWGVSKEQLYEDPSPMWRGASMETREELRKVMESARRTGTTWRLIWEHTGPNGDERWLEGWGHPYLSTEGVLRWDCFVMDITDQKKRDIEFEFQANVVRQAQKQESIGQLTGGMAHDFNNMLAVIRGNLEMLEDDLADELSPDDERMDFIRGSILAAEQGNDLTRKMLSFARRAPLNPEVIQLNTVVQELEGWSGRTFPANITLTTHLAEGLPPVLLDRSSTSSALLNLMVNARDAMPNGGTLTLSTRVVTLATDQNRHLSQNLGAGQYVVLSVSDTGDGIKPDHLTKIFEPFYTTKAPGAGSGLGLSMVQGFVAQSGGAIDIQSTLGEGTVIDLYFPPAELGRTSFASTIKVEEETSSTGLHILLAEDHKDVRLMLERSLTRMGHKVTAAETGDMAMQLFEKNPGFDLLVTDIVMPGSLQGTDLVREIRKRVADFPVIVLTGYTDLPLNDGSILRPEDIRLNKPVARASLERALTLTAHRARPS